jgi:glycosyltransferase involved in cell wall biosynthesis
MARPKVAVVHPRLGWGGSEARALWALQALRHDYDVSLITCGPVDLPRLNEYYGTALNSGDFTLLQVVPLGLKAGMFDAVQARILKRYCERCTSRFDVMISAYNLCSFGAPGIHFVADLSFVSEWRFAPHPSLQNRRRWWYADSALRRAYLGLCNLISPSQRRAWSNDIIVANSEWSARLIRDKFGIEARTLYPPVATELPTVPETEKENGFVCLARVVPEKRVDKMVEILAQVRRRGHDIHLHVLGGFGDGRYERQLKRMTSGHRDWVFFEGKVFEQRKKDLLARHRFGIHGCENEAFGIAVAEMVKAGCIVFVPDGSGPTEIVNHPGLIYEDDEAAVEKIDAVLSDPEKQRALREHLRVAARRFSVVGFEEGLLEITREFLERKSAGNAGKTRATGSD